MSKDLLLEIGTEEIPAKFMPGILGQLSKLASDRLTNERIQCIEIKTYGTPRRIALMIKGMAERQENQIVESRGPSLKVAFGQDGSPSKAAQGFARGQGIDVKDLIVKDGYVYAVKQEVGTAVKDKLPQLLVELIASLSFTKSMRWGDEEVRFVRPVRWLVALFGTDVIEVSFAGVHSGKTTRGHRFLSKTAIGIDSAADYIEKLSEQYVMVDQDLRRSLIKEQVQTLALQLGGTAEIDNDLLEEVTFLVEYPTALYGTFEEKFLTLPKEAIITPMREHQRYFPVFDGEGKLLPVFITVRNGSAEYIDTVRHGNERVLRARLADAEFFFLEDRKAPLAERIPSLKTIVFQEGLGTIYDKAVRLQGLSVEIAKAMGAPEEMIPIIERAAMLAKADLVTSMVCEFTELQGIMGREYAILDGENVDTATAIYEHYLPRFSGDVLPVTVQGSALSIADKVDNIVATFSRGLIPTGSQDPFALRRQTLGIINILIKGKYNLILMPVLLTAMERLNVCSSDRSNLLNSIVEFIEGRLKTVLLDEGIRYDVVDTIMNGKDSVYHIWLKCQALMQEIDSSYLPMTIAAFSRAGNLADKAKTCVVNPDLFVEESEMILYQTLLTQEEEIQHFMNGQDFVAVLGCLAKMIKPINEFFEAVMVMAEDEAVRNNRLALLKQVTKLSNVIGDLRKIVNS